jgi:hypothetical protein
VARRDRALALGLELQRPAAIEQGASRGDVDEGDLFQEEVVGLRAG